MTHRRTSIRAAVVSLLAGASTSAGSRVYDTRLFPANTQPAVIVTTPSDNYSEMVGLTGIGDFMRELTVQVEAYAQANSALGSSLDTLCEEIEAAVFGDPYLADESITFRILRVRLESTSLEYTLETDPQGGRAQLQFVYTYEEAN